MVGPIEKKIFGGQKWQNAIFGLKSKMAAFRGRTILGIALQIFFFCHDACQWSILSDFKWDRAIFKQNGFYWAPLITVHDIEVITRDKNSWLLTKYDDTKLLIVKSNDIEKSFSWSKWKAKGCVVLYFYSHSMICQF